MQQDGQRVAQQRVARARAQCKAAPLRQGACSACVKWGKGV
jgi:hypothetical protein